MIKRIMCAILSMLFFPVALSFAQNIVSSGQTVYVPAYSSIFHGDKKREFDLSITISIRNTNMKQTININSIEYYNTTGAKLKNFVTDTKKLAPLESIQYSINESDFTGGVGANFIVKWSSLKKVNPPIIETIMIGTKGQQGISFSSRGVAIEENL